MNNMEIIKHLIEKIKLIEQEFLETEDSESRENRGKIVNSIIEELNKVVITDEN